MNGKCKRFNISSEKDCPWLKAILEILAESASRSLLAETARQD
jgi:hypothetical protein